MSNEHFGKRSVQAINNEQLRG